MKKIFGLIISFVTSFNALAQENNNTFKNGYALKGMDTIWCKIFFDSKHDHPVKTIKLLIAGEETIFYAGGTITGFGLAENGVAYNYGTVDVETSIGDRRMANMLFVKKLVAGRIDFYEYSYSVHKSTTKTVTRDGIQQPPTTTSSTTQTFFDYYIAKNDSLKPALSKAVLLSSFKIKDIEPYVSDYPDLLTKAEKRFTMKELIIFLNEYNKEYLTQSK
ncbi:MAG: hypothetical protein HZB42_15075 [Sphingobacteriales bacterium]|nr:hypothetical protein [Sphingobacteriales bacterium]